MSTEASAMEWIAIDLAHLGPGATLHDLRRTIGMPEEGIRLTLNRLGYEIAPDGALTARPGVEDIREPGSRGDDLRHRYHPPPTLDRGPAPTPPPPPTPDGQRYALVDIGANDGAKYADRITSAAGPVLLVEALPHLVARLRARFADAPHVTCVEAAVASVAERRTLHYIPDEVIDPTTDPPWLSQLGSFRPRHAAGLKHDDDIRTHPVDCLTPTQLLHRHGVTAIEELVIDTEGADVEILMAFPWDDVPVETVIFEHKHAVREQLHLLTHLLEGRGYRVRQIDEENAIAERITPTRARRSLIPAPYSDQNYPPNAEAIRHMREAVARGDVERAGEEASRVLATHARQQSRLAQVVTAHHDLTGYVGHRDLLREIGGLCRQAVSCPVCDALRVLGRLV